MQSELAVANEVAKLREGLSGGLQVIAGKTGFHSDKSKTFGLWEFPFGPRGSKVRIEITRKALTEAPFNEFKMRFELNPRKLQPAGFTQLVELFSQAAPQFNFGAFLKDARPTRVDAAIDFTGVASSELLLTISKPGKTATYHGADGVLETLYAFKWRAPRRSP